MINIWIIVLALIGFIISWYIYYKKIKNEKLVCLAGDDCNEVLNSKYSKMLNIPNEVLGMAYYGFVIFFVALLLSGVKQIGIFPVELALIAIGGLTAFITIIQLYIMLFVLRKMCDYCLVINAITIAIFIIEII
ncbi:MAG: hypothetical protein KJI71_03270 [Patescibacteria group bacterium]|nr:hypothetical protein [Patescibacteria group bacterium]